MKKIIITFIALFAYLGSFCQTEANPFAEYGYNVLTATSSQGEFEEFYDMQEVVEIASVLYNTRTKQIVGFINEEENKTSSAIVAMSIDPHCERYYWISPYAYCLNNPIKLIDPDGRDVWNVNEQGQIIFLREDKNVDMFQVIDDKGNIKIDKNGNEISISFAYGTVESIKEVGIRISNTDGTASTLNSTMVNVKGDENATQLFEFMAQPERTTNVEWSHAKMGTQSSGRNVVGTSHEQSSTAVGAYLNAAGYSLREVNHNHPNGTWRLSDGDLKNRVKYINNHPNIKLNIYANKRYRPYADLKDMVISTWN